MPIDTEKAGDPVSRKGVIPFEKDAAMKNGINDELVKAIGKLSEEDKKQVAKFIDGLSALRKSTYAKTPPNLTGEEVAAISALSDHLCRESEHADGFDVLELMKSIRR